jgi:hypothetical protein
MWWLNQYSTWSHCSLLTKNDELAVPAWLEERSQLAIVTNHKLKCMGSIWQAVTTLITAKHLVWRHVSEQDPTRNDMYTGEILLSEFGSVDLPILWEVSLKIELRVHEWGYYEQFICNKNPRWKSSSWWVMKLLLLNHSTLWSAVGTTCLLTHRPTVRLKLKTLCTLHTACTCAFCMVIRINSDYFSKHH